MDLNLKDKVVAVAGGTSGIGEAVAMDFAKEGCKVAVCGRSQSKIDAMQAAFQKEGFELLTMSVDVGVNAQLKSFTEAVVETYGRLDIFINNAGISIRKPFETLSEEDEPKICIFRLCLRGRTDAQDRRRCHHQHIVLYVGSTDMRKRCILVNQSSG